YPLMTALLAWLRHRTVLRERYASCVSVVLAAHNEASRLERRLRELIGLMQSSGVAGEIIVVSDGSTDGTVELARSFARQGVGAVELPERGGKAAALSAGAAAARHEVLVFADARQQWDPQALTSLLENFADPRVGGVSGELVLESAPGVLAGVGLYWRYEKWL